MLHKILRQLPPEQAHAISLALLRRLPIMGKNGFTPTAVKMSTHVMGTNFVNPIGVAAGFDKNGTVFHKMISRRVGFGFAEVGTVTPVAQKGNFRDKDNPRIIRFPKEEMLFNRLGFNNDGLLKVVENLMKNKHSLGTPYDSVVGLNIGKNGHTPWNEKTIKDYVLCAKSAAEHVGYLMVNISSPNTPNLISTMNDEVMLKELLDEIHYSNQ